MSKSRPVYAPLRCDPTGRRHLLVSQSDPDQAALAAFCGQEPRPVEVWVASGDGVEPASEARDGAGPPPQRFASAGVLLEALSDRLRRETMGLRLYGLGDEAFLWDLSGVASAAGLGRGEIRLSRVGAPTRRVYCTHCATMNEDVHADLVVCRGCGLTLAVRDHFSRRLSAFMGVHADAEAPGVLPQAQALGS